MRTYNHSSPVPGTFRRNPYWKLQALFRERGFHDYEVAAAIGTSPQCLSRRIRGAAPWPSDEVAAICKIVGIPQEQIGYYFFPDVEPEGKKEASA